MYITQNIKEKMEKIVDGNLEESLKVYEKIGDHIIYILNAEALKSVLDKARMKEFEFIKKKLKDVDLPAQAEYVNENKSSILKSLVDSTALEVLGKHILANHPEAEEALLEVTDDYMANVGKFCGITQPFHQYYFVGTDSQIQKVFDLGREAEI